MLRRNLYTAFFGFVFFWQYIFWRYIIFGLGGKPIWTDDQQNNIHSFTLIIIQSPDWFPNSLSILCLLSFRTSQSLSREGTYVVDSFHEQCELVRVEFDLVFGF